MAVGCTPAEAPHKDTEPTKTVLDTATDTTDTATTDTGPDINPANVCPDVIPELPRTYADTQFTTEEDFDFDGGGYLLTQSGGSIAALDRSGDVQIIPVPGFQDPSGLRVDAAGDIVLAEPNTGDLRIVFRANGASAVLISGMANPNGIAADSLGYVVVTDFWNSGRVALVDPATRDIYEISQSLPSPNGVSFSQDGQRLYIVTSNGIMRAERLSDTEFTEPVAFAAFPDNGNFWTVTLDVCDRIYTVNYSTGKVWRAEPDGTGWVGVVDIDNWGSYSAIRFGGGEGGWDRDTLYVTSRSYLYSVPIGVNGIAPVAPVY